MSYSRHDRDYVNHLANHLTAAGLLVWHDYDAPYGKRRHRLPPQLPYPTIPTTRPPQRPTTHPAARSAPQRASIHLAAGADVKVVQQLLGHTASTLTRDTYRSVLPELHQKAGNDVAARLATKRANRRRRAA